LAVRLHSYFYYYKGRNRRSSGGLSVMTHPSPVSRALQLILVIQKPKLSSTQSGFRTVKSQWNIVTGEREPCDHKFIPCLYNPECRIQWNRLGWTVKKITYRHIHHQHFHTFPIALPVCRNPQHWSLLIVVSATSAPSFQPLRHQRNVCHPVVDRFTRQALPTVNRKKISFAVSHFAHKKSA
jgi:hypothetical protein